VRLAANFQFRLFGRDILIYTIANGLVLALSVLQGFILPKFLSVEGYGYWQLFSLYGTYSGLLHLGFADGILLRWAGKDVTCFGPEIKKAFNFLTLQQITFIVPLGVLAYFLIPAPFQWIIVMVFVLAFISNLAIFFTFAAQASKKFWLLAVVNVGRTMVFVLFLILLLNWHYLEYPPVILAYLVSFVITLMVLVLFFSKYLGFGSTKNKSMPDTTSATGNADWKLSVLSYGKKNIGIGLYILLGNLIFLLLLSIDKLMVSIFFDIGQFAIYAFASSVVIIVYTLLRSISEVIFPYLAGAFVDLQHRAYELAELAIILAWAAMLIVYFPFVRIVEIYLMQYVTSLPLIQILLCSFSVGSLIQILHVNYYRVYLRQRQYFLSAIGVLMLAVLFIFLAIRIWDTLEGVIIAMFISLSIWYVINELNLSSVLNGQRRTVFIKMTAIISYAAAFWITPLFADWFVARMLVYLGFYLVITWLMFRHQLRDLIEVGLRIKRQLSMNE